MASEHKEALDRLVPHGQAAATGQKNRWSFFSNTSSESSDASERHHWMKTEQAHYFFTCIILANAVFMGVDVDVSLKNGGNSGPLLFWIGVIFYLIFLFEIVVRIHVDGRRFFCLSNYSGLFDLFIVIASTLEYLVIWLSGTGGMALVSMIRFCRLFRIVRIVRVLHLCPELWLLASSLASSMRLIAWAFCLLLVMLYISCLICTMELADQSEELQEYFGSIDRSLFTHVKVLTLEGYPEVADAAGKAGWLWYLYIALFIIASSILFIGLVTGIVVEHVCSKSKTLETSDLHAAFDLHHFQELFVDLYSAAGFSLDEEIGLEEFRNIFRSEAIRDGMNALDICLGVDESELFKILDFKGCGKLTVEEMIAGLMRLQGSKHFLQSLFSQGDVVSSSLKTKRKIKDSQGEVSRYSESICAALEDKLSQHVKDIWRATESLPVPHAASLCKQPVLHHLPQLLDTLEASSSEAGKVLARLKKQLKASRERVSHLEGKICKRVGSVQTENPLVSVSDEWNHDREMVVNQVPILAEKMIEPVTMDFTRGIERLLDEQDAARKVTLGLKDEADFKVTVTIVQARGLLGKTGRLDLCCTCAIPGKPESQFVTRVASDTSDPRWDETHELTDFQYGDPIEFVVLDMNTSPSSSKQLKKDACVAAGKLLGEQFFPHGFDGELELTEASAGRSNFHPSLQVKVHVQGSALKQVLTSPAFDFDAVSSINQDDASSLHGSKFWPRSPQLTPMRIKRQDDDLQRFRRHPCKSGKESALDAMRTPSDSDDEERLGAWRRSPEHQRLHQQRSSSASPSLSSTIPSQSLLQLTPASVTTTPRTRGHSVDSATRQYVTPISQPSKILVRSTPRPLIQPGWREAPSK